MADLRDPAQQPAAAGRAQAEPPGVPEAPGALPSAAILAQQLDFLARALAQRHAFLDTPPLEELGIAQGEAGLLAWAMMAGLLPDPALQRHLAAWLRGAEEDGEADPDLEAGDLEALLERGLTALGEMVRSGGLEQRLSKALVLDGEATPPLSGGVSAWHELSAYLDPLDASMTMSGVVVPAAASLPAVFGSGSTGGLPTFGHLLSDDLARDDLYTKSSTTIQADFDAGADDFTYADDAFRATAQPGYADGAYIGAGGFSGGALRVLLGSLDNVAVLGMSGGWEREITLSEASEVSVTFRYQLTHSGHHENDEYAEVMFSVDGALYGSGANDYIVRITGDGDGGPDLTTGWQSFSADIGVLAAGTHSVIIGGYANKKTFNDEFAEVLIDEVSITDSGPLVVTAAEGLLANDIPRNGLDLSVLLDSGPSDGTLSLSPDGSFSYTPDVGFTGLDSFDYRVTDGIFTDSGSVVLEVA